MTQYEFRYWCVTKPYTVWYLGSSGGSTDYTIDQIKYGEAPDLVRSHFDHLFEALSFNPSIPFQEKDDTIYKVFTDKYPERYIINLWVGHTEPQCRVTNTELSLPPNKRNYKMILLLPFPRIALTYLKDLNSMLRVQFSFSHWLMLIFKNVLLKNIRV